MVQLSCLLPLVVGNPLSGASDVAGRPRGLLTRAPPAPRPRCFGNACCSHADCAPLREHALCRRWYMIGWAAAPRATARDMLGELRRQLAQRDFGFQPALVDDGAALHEALVKIEPDGSAHGMAPFLLPAARSRAFDRARSAVWPIRCCWRVVRERLPAWLARLRPQGRCDDDDDDDDDEAAPGETYLAALLLAEVRRAAEGGSCRHVSSFADDVDLCGYVDVALRVG